MNNPVVWFEVMGRNAQQLRTFYGEIFDWKYTQLPDQDYGMVTHTEGQIGGGVGAAPGDEGWTTFYVKVDDPKATLQQVTARGGAVVLPPTRLADGNTIALFTDPEGHPVGLYADGDQT